MIKLIMLSGGIDSCALLIKELTESKDLIHVHHVEMICYENRHDYENIAVKKIIEYCKKNYREFEFSSSTFAYPNFLQNSVSDNITISFIASHIGKGLIYSYGRKYNKIFKLKALIGTCKDDITFSLEAAQTIFESNFFNVITKGIPLPSIEHPFVNTYKHQFLHYIPEELRQHTASCRNPSLKDDKYIRCGYCSSCKKNKLAFERFEKRGK